MRGNPFDYLLTGLDVKLPMEYALPLRAALEPYLRQSSSAEVREFARSLAEECGWQTMAFLGALNQRLFDRTRQVVREVGAPFAAGDHLARTGRLLPRSGGALLRRLPRGGTRGPFRERI